MAQTFNEYGDTLDVYDDNDLFLTNAITDSKETDAEEKKRYHKNYNSYFYATSSSRNNPVIDLFAEPSLTSTGNIYTNLSILFPFDSSSMSLPITKIQFKIRDIFIPTDPIQIISGIINSETSVDTELFDVYIPVDTLTNYTLGELASTIQSSINNLLFNRSSSQLIHSSDAANMFNVSAHIDTIINPDKITITISCQINFEFILTFTFSNNTIQEPIYPNPNNYSLYLDKTYSNIKCLRIIDAEIPFSDTIINEWNNIIEFKIRQGSTDIYTTDGSLTWKLVLDIGNYSITSFLSYFLLSLNTYIFTESGIANLFSIDPYNSENEIINIRITPTYTFEMIFINDNKYGARNLYKMLGFKIPSTSSYTSIFTNSITINTGSITYIKPYSPVNLATSKIIWININNIECVYDSYSRSFYFNKYPINKLLPIQYNYTFATEPHLFKLDISLFDEVGVPYNTNMADHSFTLEIIWYLDRLTGTDLSSRRGTNNIN